METIVDIPSEIPGKKEDEVFLGFLLLVAYGPSLYLVSLLRRAR